MRKINRNNAPASFLTYKNKNNATYSDIDTSVRNNLKEALLKQRQGLCGYCQQKINQSNMGIEHWCEQSICNGENSFPDRRLDYTNMIAVCNGKTGNEIYCDTQKSKFSIENGLPIEISPFEQAHINTINYSSSGIIKSSNEKFNDEINRLLNLNTKFLKNKRKNKWLTIFKHSRSKNGKVSIQKQKMKRLLEQNIQLSNSVIDIEFIGLSEYMMKKFCS